MPTLGERKRANELGLKGHEWKIWAACPDCKRERWTQLSNWEQKNGEVYCVSCGSRRTFKRPEFHEYRSRQGKKLSADQQGSKNRQWKGGRSRTSQGYLYVYVDEDDPLFCMKGHGGRIGGYVLEHRLVMARHLGRPLRPGETVHHRNGDRLDNRLENLELWNGGHGGGRRPEDWTVPQLEAEIERLQAIVAKKREG